MLRFRDRNEVTKQCTAIVDIARASVVRHFGLHSDDFDQEMAAYTGLGIFLTFIYFFCPEEVSKVGVIWVLDWAEKNQIQKERVAVIYASLKTNWGSVEDANVLAKNIVEHLSCVSSNHEQIFEDLVFESQKCF